MADEPRALRSALAGPAFATRAIGFAEHAATRHTSRWIAPSAPSVGFADRLASPWLVPAQRLANRFASPTIAAEHEPAAASWLFPRPWYRDSIDWLTAARATGTVETRWAALAPERVLPPAPIPNAIPNAIEERANITELARVARLVEARAELPVVPTRVIEDPIRREAIRRDAEALARALQSERVEARDVRQPDASSSAGRTLHEQARRDAARDATRVAAPAAPVAPAAIAALEATLSALAPELAARVTAQPERARETIAELQHALRLAELQAHDRPAPSAAPRVAMPAGLSVLAARVDAAVAGTRGAALGRIELREPEARVATGSDVRPVLGAVSRDANRALDTARVTLGAAPVASRSALGAAMASTPAALGHVAWADRWLARFGGASQASLDAVALASNTLGASPLGAIADRASQLATRTTALREAVAREVDMPVITPAEPPAADPSRVVRFDDAAETPDDVFAAISAAASRTRGVREAPRPAAQPPHEVARVVEAAPAPAAREPARGASDVDVARALAARGVSEADVARALAIRGAGEVDVARVLAARTADVARGASDADLAAAVVRGSEADVARLFVARGVSEADARALASRAAGEALARRSEPASDVDLAAALARGSEADVTRVLAARGVSEADARAFAARATNAGDVDLAAALTRGASDADVARTLAARGVSEADATRLIAARGASEAARRASDVDIAPAGSASDVLARGASDADVAGALARGASDAEMTRVLGARGLTEPDIARVLAARTASDGRGATDADVAAAVTRGASNADLAVMFAARGLADADVARVLSARDVEVATAGARGASDAELARLISAVETDLATQRTTDRFRDAGTRVLGATVADRIAGSAPASPGAGLSAQLASSPFATTLFHVMPLAGAPVFDVRALSGESLASAFVGGWVSPGLRALAAPELEAIYVAGEDAAATSASAEPITTLRASLWAEPGPAAPVPASGAPGTLAQRAQAWSVEQERSSADLALDFVTPELVLAARVYGMGPAEAAQAARLGIEGASQLAAMAGVLDRLFADATAIDRSRLVSATAYPIGGGLAARAAGAETSLTSFVSAPDGADGGGAPVDLARVTDAIRIADAARGAASAGAATVRGLDAGRASDGARMVDSLAAEAARAGETARIAARSGNLARAGEATRLAEALAAAAVDAARAIEGAGVAARSDADGASIDAARETAAPRELASARAFDAARVADALAAEATRAADTARQAARSGDRVAAGDAARLAETLASAAADAVRVAAAHDGTGVAVRTATAAAAIAAQAATDAAGANRADAFAPTYVKPGTAFGIERRTPRGAFLWPASAVAALGMTAAAPDGTDATSVAALELLAAKAVAELGVYTALAGDVDPNIGASIGAGSGARLGVGGFAARSGGAEPGTQDGLAGARALLERRAAAGEAALADATLVAPTDDAAEGDAPTAGTAAAPSTVAPATVAPATGAPATGMSAGRVADPVGRSSADIPFVDIASPRPFDRAVAAVRPRLARAIAPDGRPVVVVSERVPAARFTAEGRPLVTPDAPWSAARAARALAIAQRSGDATTTASARAAAAWDTLPVVYTNEAAPESRPGLSGLSSRAGEALSSFVNPAPASAPQEYTRSSRPSARAGGGEVEIPAWFEAAARKMLDERTGSTDGISLAEMTLVTSAPTANVAASTRQMPSASPPPNPAPQAAATGPAGGEIDLERLALDIYNEILAMMDAARERNGEPYR